MIRIFCDGASKGNPGPSSIGVAGLLGDKEEFTISEKIGETTNNVAEWSALKRGLEECIRRKFDSVHAFMDSELVVRQVSGRYKVKHPNLLEYKKEVDKLVSTLQSFQITHVPREKNALADRLANEAFTK
ncbi:ribonuclease HI family protein [Leptospira adleri]|uniref:ribonuclease HI family protein n=1 Tax=Leptospira adleri TaxID=2023186 RepID=UPI001083CB35|nr:ribonuclease HI family protein [Leptospira adleri]TGM56673.1 ribonuclease HI family protein [Leptospira adleri]